MSSSIQIQSWRLSIRGITILGLLFTMVNCQGVPRGTTDSVSPGSTDTLPPAIPTNSKLWQDGWLNGIPCRPPCWEEITPGITTASEAIEILKKLSHVATDTIQVGVSPLRPELGYIDWEWLNSNIAGGGGVTFEGDTAEQIVQRVALLFTTSIPLGDVVAVYGEPTHVVARAAYDPSGNITSWLQILYITQGMGLVGDSRMTIEADLQLHSVYFFSPGMDNFVQQYPEYGSNPNLIVSWQGYQNFQLYCRDEYEGRACHAEK